MCVVRNHPYTDTWPWNTAEQIEAAPATMSAPESWAAMSLTGDATANGAEVIDGPVPASGPAASGR